MSIVVATDFSPCSRTAVRLGAALARRQGVPVLLVHAVEPPALDVPTLPMGTAGLERDLAMAAEIGIARDASEVRQRGVVVETRVVFGTAASAILVAAAEQRADLIVVGTHGRKHGAHLFLGSVAESIGAIRPLPRPGHSRDGGRAHPVGRPSAAPVGGRDRWFRREPGRAGVGGRLRALAAVRAVDCPSLSASRGGGTVRPRRPVGRTTPGQRATAVTGARSASRCAGPARNDAGAPPVACSWTRRRGCLARRGRFARCRCPRHRRSTTPFGALDRVDARTRLALLGLAGALRSGRPGSRAPATQAGAVGSDSHGPLRSVEPGRRSGIRSPVAGWWTCRALHRARRRSGRYDCRPRRVAVRRRRTREARIPGARAGSTRSGVGRNHDERLGIIEARFAAEAILAAAERLDVDLIAVASHGRSGIMRALLGSVAEEVARRSPRPVLIIRSQQPA